jgi:hypothetical protein
MSKSKSHKDNEDIKYTREMLLKSEALGDYQKDFAAVILTKETYTIDEAKAALDAVLGRKEV